MIKLEHVTIQRGARVLLDNAEAAIFAGQRIGLIGANGAGKTTLLEVLAGAVQPDGGEVHRPAGITIARSRQEIDASDRSALDFAIDGDRRFRNAEHAICEAEAAHDATRLAVAHQAFEEADGFTVGARAARILAGLGFSESSQARPVSAFSGGWRVRLALAQVLMSRADLLLLDEPTNHLDLDAVLWLEEWLLTSPGTLVVVSHDRDFLDRVTDTTFHLCGAKLTTYRGNYSAFERQRAEQMSVQQAQYEKQRARAAHMQKFIDRFRAKATKARQAQSRIKALERMAALQPAHFDSPFSFEIPCYPKLSNPLVSLRGATAGHDGKVAVRADSLDVRPGDRIALLGRNGAGKSTLLKTLAGRLALLDGERIAGEHLRTGYFAQHQIEVLDLASSAFDHLRELSPAATEQQIRDYLGGFDFHDDRVFEPVATFSGGEKARLALAMIAWQRPNLLILDEPTNHLDLEMRRALALALQDYPGAVLLVTHDRNLLQTTAQTLMLVANGTVVPFDGDLDSYADMLRKAPADIAAQTSSTASDSRRQRRQRAASERERLKPQRRRVEALERDIERVNDELALLQKQLAEPDAYDDANRDRLGEWLQRRGTLDKELAALEEQWMAEQEVLEEMMAQVDAT